MTRGWNWWGAALWVSILAAGCDNETHTAASTKPHRRGGSDGGNAGNHAPSGPMCLEPPWVPGDTHDGVQKVACASEQEFGLVLPGTNPLTEDLGLEFLERHRDAIHSIDGVESSGLGLCCEGTFPSPNAHCVTIGLRLCSTEAADLIAELRAMQSSTAASADIPFQISIELIGLLGPRCEADECGPLPYSDSNTNPPPARRRLVYPPQAAPNCEHDGECVESGCGNQCDHWSEGGGFGTCEGRGELEAAFCGCVEQQCAWFR